MSCPSVRTGRADRRPPPLPCHIPARACSGLRSVRIRTAFTTAITLTGGGVLAAGAGTLVFLRRRKGGASA
ncbi:hypothetical protein [Kitasatospora aureofaciens]|uniref:hypothetical protein n=1 Tax=Kitasatospora aureofaciens TaxID=1894 RepID=UPI0038008F3C